MTNDTKKKFVFFGTPRFAEIVLEKLIKNGLWPSLVVCNPDKPMGRKKIITPPITKILAERYEIPVFQPESLLNSKFEIPRPRQDEAAGGRNSKFAILAAYGKIIPREIIDSFPKGIIGIHPSLLPKYRGATPIQSTILAGETETGVTLFLMDEKIDHGKIISNSKLLISNEDTYESLEEKLARLGAELVMKTVTDYLNGEIEPREQNYTEATFTKKFTTNDTFVDNADLQAALNGDKEKAIKIDRMVRALNPEPGVWTLQNGKRTKLLESEIKDEKLVLKIIQMEGKNPQEISN